MRLNPQLLYYRVQKFEEGKHEPKATQITLMEHPVYWSFQMFLPFNLISTFALFGIY